MNYNQNETISEVLQSISIMLLAASIIITTFKISKLQKQVNSFSNVYYECNNTNCNSNNIEN